MIESLYSKINESKFDAFQYILNDLCYEYNIAYQEGCIWLELGFKLEKNNYFNRQAYVVLIYASELFLKSILMKNNINFSRTHDLFSLFNLVNDECKAIIKKKIEIDKLEIVDKDNNIIGYLNDFEDYLKFISNYFVDLRYDFEKINSNNSTIIPTNFINKFVFNLYEFCKRELEK